MFELIIYSLFAGVVWHARRQGRGNLLEFLWTGLYGLLLEWLTIHQLHAYAYGRFVIMIDNAPLCIALGWAVVIYTGMRFTDLLKLQELIRPLVDALIGLSLDLIVDVMAVRLGLWMWTGLSPDQQWFGVPWLNFEAWFVIIWSYSTFIRALRPWQRLPFHRWFYPPLAILLSLALLAAGSAFYNFMPAEMETGAVAVLFLIGGSLVMIAGSRSPISLRRLPEPIVILVPVTFHAFVIIAGASAGIFARQPILAAIELALLAASITLYGVPLWIPRRNFQNRSELRR